MKTKDQQSLTLEILFQQGYVNQILALKHGVHHLNAVIRKLNDIGYKTISYEQHFFNPVSEKVELFTHWRLEKSKMTTEAILTNRIERLQQKYVRLAETLNWEATRAALHVIEIELTNLGARIPPIQEKLGLEAANDPYFGLSSNDAKEG